MNPTICIQCQRDNMYFVRPYRSKTAHGKALFNGSKLFKCADCGLVQVLPKPTLKSLEDYYHEDYRKGCFAGAGVADLAEFPRDNRFYFNRGNSIAALLADHLPMSAPRILDVGAGYGHILDAFGRQFPEATREAIEVSEQCIQHLRSLGIKVHAQPAENVIPTLDEGYDLIILSHVLEHLLEPHETMKMIYEKLRPGGLFYVEVPNIPAESLRRYADNVWAPRFDEPHITFFEKETLAAALSRTGFDVQFCDTAGKEYTYVSWLTFHMPHWRWFLERVTPKPLFNFLRRQKMTHKLRVQDREESFYQYGGFRIWVRGIARRAAA